MGRGLATLAVLAALCGVASADSTRKVEILTEPPGATVYLGDLETGVACTPTPCSVEAPAGKRTAVIARKDGYVEGYGSIDLRHGSMKSVSITLEAATGTLVCDDSGLAGGTILVDDVDKGKAPAHVAVEAGAHHVVVVVKGRAVYDEFPKIELGHEYIVKPNMAEPAPLPPKQTPTVSAIEPSNGDDTSGGSDDPNATKVAKHAETGPHEMWIAGGGVFAVGFRQFKYDNPKNLAPTEDEGGQVLVGPSIQIWPMRLIDSDHLRGLSLYGKVLFGANSRAVLQDPNNMPTGAQTFWGNIEIDLQHRWEIGDAGALELGGGFVRDQLVYKGNTDQVANVPYADYMSMRIGVKGSLHLGPIEPYASVEGRIPFSEGLLATRFSKPSVTGAGAAAGLAAAFGPLVARFEASIVYYSWTLSPLAPGPTQPSADGASDAIESISLLVGLSY